MSDEETSDTESVHASNEPLRYELQCSACGAKMIGYKKHIGLLHDECEWNSPGTWELSDNEKQEAFVKNLMDRIQSEPEIKKDMLVSVFWWDAYGVEQDWNDEPMKKLASNLSFGIITRISDEAITIAPHFAGSGKNRLACGDMIIPLCTVAGLQHLPSGRWLIECEDLQEMSWIKKGRYQKL